MIFDDEDDVGGGEYDATESWEDVERGEPDDLESWEDEIGGEEGQGSQGEYIEESSDWDEDEEYDTDQDLESTNLDNLDGHIIKKRKKLTSNKLDTSSKEITKRSTLSLGRKPKSHGNSITGEDGNLIGYSGGRYKEPLPPTSPDITVKADPLSLRGMTDAERIKGNKWLDSHGEVQDVEQNIDGYGMAKARDFALGRTSHMEVGVRHAHKSIIDGNVPSYLNLDPLMVTAYKTEFNNLITEDDTGLGGFLPKIGEIGNFRKLLGNTDGELGGRVTNISPTTGLSLGSFMPSQSTERDYTVALSMMGKTTGSYLDKGPGSPLVGNHLLRDKGAEHDVALTNSAQKFRNEKSLQDDLDLTEAIATSREIAGLLVQNIPKDSPIYESRLESVQGDVVKRMFGNVGGSVIGLPNEYPTGGLTTTQVSGGTGQGTGYTTLEHQAEFSDHLVKNAKGYYELKVGTPDSIVEDYWSTRGNVKDSLFPLEKYNKNNPLSKEDFAARRLAQTNLYAALNEKANRAKEVFRTQQPEHLDETLGRKNFSAFSKPRDDQAESENLRNQADILGQDYTAGDDVSGSSRANYQGQLSVTTVNEVGISPPDRNTKNPFGNTNYSLKRVMTRVRLDQATRKLSATSVEESALSSSTTRKDGSDKGGLHGSKLESESQTFTKDNRLNHYPTKDEEKPSQNLMEGNVIENMIAEEEAASFVGPQPFTDRDKYLKSIRDNKPADQGTDEWLKEREGDVTASMFPETTGKFKTEDLAMKLARERLGDASFRWQDGSEGNVTEQLGKSFKGNSDTREGNDSEGKVLKSLMAELNDGREKKDYLQYEEAYYEKGEEGFGASVDGRLFDAKGKSLGNMELKYLSPKAIAGSRKKYYEQMQFQMMVNKEKVTHFAVKNRETGQLHYEKVYADPSVQDKLKAHAEDALAAQGELTVEDILAMKEKRSRSRTKAKPIENTGQTQAYKEVGKEAEEDMVAFNPNDSVGRTPTASALKPVEERGDDQANVNSDIIRESYGKEVDPQNKASAISPTGKPRSERSEEIQSSAKARYESNKELARERQAQTDRANSSGSSEARAQASVAIPSNENYGPKAFDGIDEKSTDHGYADEVKSLADAAKGSSRALKGFESALGKVASVALEVANRLLDANKEGSDIIRLSKSVGEEDTEITLGMRDLLHREGLTPEGAEGAIRDAGSQAKKLSTYGQAAEEVARMSALNAQQDNGMTLIDVVGKNYSAQEYTAAVIDSVEGATNMSRLEKTFAYEEIYRVGGVNNFTGSAQEIRDARKALPEDGLLESQKSINTAEQDIADFARNNAGDLPEETSYALRMGKEVLDSTSGGLLIGGAAYGAVKGGQKLLKGHRVRSRAGELKKQANPKRSIPKAKALSGASKALALAARGGSMLLRGAAMATPVGAAVGVGLTAYAAGSYAYENFLDEDTKDSVSSGIDDAVDYVFGDDDSQDRLDNISGTLGYDNRFPERDIGGISANTREDTKPILNSNVSVNVNVDPRLTETEVDDNGVLTLDRNNYA